jgi:Ca-activated chloride channel family protein
MKPALVLLIVLMTVWIVATQDSPEPRVRILSPTPDSFLSGPVLLQAEIAPASQARLVAEVSFFADGRLVCRDTTRPFECPWDAGAGVRAHQIRVAALLTDGRRLVETVRTKELGYVERVTVPVVQVTAVVTDESGRFVDGLERDAFRVLDEEVEQRITYFGAEEAPLHVVVAVDVSGSMTDAMPSVRTAVKSFLAALKPETELTLVAFNDNVFIPARRAANPASRIEAVDLLEPWGGTALYDALVKSLDVLAQGAGRKALVIFSDGDDQSSFSGRDAANARVEASDAVIFTIAQGRGTTEARFRAVLDGMAQISGGRAFFTDNMDELDRAFREIGIELSHQYLLGFTPSASVPDGTWRRLRVELRDKSLRVRARRGYRTGGEPGGS